jgi:hypothetical protein
MSPDILLGALLSNTFHLCCSLKTRDQFMLKEKVRIKITAFDVVNIFYSFEAEARLNNI